MDETVAVSVAPSETQHSAAPRRPTVPEVRGQMPADTRRRDLLLGVMAFATAASLYGLTFWGALAAPWWPLQVGCAVLSVLFIGTLFVVGHDACHGSLTPFSALNQVLGRLAFFPSLTPFSQWEFGHNGIHHSYTNYRPRDVVWGPLSKEEFDRLPRHRQWMHRHYRSLAGLGTYYLFEVWIKLLIFPSSTMQREMKRPRTFIFDRLLLVALVVLQIWLVVAYTAVHPVEPSFWSAFTSPAALIVIAVVMPYLLWNWYIGFAVFLQHNHPRVAWFMDRDEWDFFAGQVEGTTHITLPWYLEWASAFVMQHTAHHVDPKIPLYRLTESQHYLEQSYPHEIVVERWTLRSFLNNLEKCKLYDYQDHCWLSFDGQPTSPPNPLLAALRQGNAPLRRRK